MQRLKELTEYKLKRQLKYIKIEEECDQYRNALDEKNKFLQNLGISAGGEFKRIKFYIESLKNKYNEKVKECEELKEQLQANQPTGICETCMAKATLQNDKYRKDLEEIKKIAEPFCNACQEFEPEKRGRNCMYCNYGKILQKISECEVNND